VDTLYRDVLKPEKQAPAPVDKLVDTVDNSGITRGKIFL
jgi:hypothetical protein